MRCGRGVLVLLLIGVALAGCSRQPANATAPPAAPAAPRASAVPAAPWPDESSRPKVVVLGDSLAAGLGLSQSDAYPALIEQKLRAAGYDWAVVNAGVSGDTSAAGLARAD